MPRHCSVVFCKSNYNNKREGSVSTFSLPKDKLLRKIWIRNIRTDVSNIKNPYVCVKHFREEDVIWEDKCTVKGVVKYFPRKNPKLKEGALPKVHYFPSSSESVRNAHKKSEDLEFQSDENADELISLPNIIGEENLSHDFKRQSFELSSTCDDSDESNILYQAKGIKSSELLTSNNLSCENMDIESSVSPGEAQKIGNESTELLEDYLNENTSDIASLWTNNSTIVQLSQDMEREKSGLENNELMHDLVKMNSKVVKHLKISNDMKHNMLQEMKLSNKLKLAELKIKCKIYDLDLDIINSDE